MRSHDSRPTRRTGNRFSWQHVHRGGLRESHADNRFARSVQYTCATNVPPGNVQDDCDRWNNVRGLGRRADAGLAPPGTSGTTLDLASLSMANDSSNLYLLITYNQPVNPNSSDGTNVYLAVDNDSNLSTGFDVLGLGLIGSEVGWENDFPFAQSNGVFNTNGGITGGTPRSRRTTL